MRRIILLAAAVELRDPHLVGAEIQLVIVMAALLTLLLSLADGRSERDVVSEAVKYGESSPALK